jgi:diguanylate cyclase (GGDEF)-like protein
VGHQLSPLGDTTLGGRPTDPEHVQRVLLDSARTLLRVDSAEQAVGVLIRAVSDLGGSTVPAGKAAAGAIPIDISLGEADPLLPTAASGSQARATLEQLIPGLVEDAKVAAARVGRLDQLSEEAETDPLTGLANRRSLSRIRVRQHVDSIAMLDLDRFKLVNDTYGHPAGDRVLVAFSRALRQHLRSTDSVFRFGGEEFLLIMPGTTPAGVLVVLEDLRRRWQAVRPLPVTFSAGVAEVVDADLSASVLNADGALYRAKENGRDRFELCVAGPDGPVPITRTAVAPVAVINT